jgi:hypothetical protein
MESTPTLSAVDKDALERAIAIVLRHREPIYRRNFKRRLDERKEPWSKIAKHAASICQGDAYDLKPWQIAPCEAEINTTDVVGHEQYGVRKASIILERLLAAGKSRYEPDAEVLKRIADQCTDVSDSVALSALVGL